MDETPVTDRQSTDVAHVAPLILGAVASIQPLEPALVSVPDAGRYLGGIVSREVYRLVDRGHLKGVKLGRRRMIHVESLRAYVARLLEESEVSDVNDDESDMNAA